MRLSRLLRPSLNTRFELIQSCTSCVPNDSRWSRSCSCGATFALFPSSPLHAPYQAHRGREKVRLISKPFPAPDHRVIGVTQSLFTSHISSPGAPFFQPNGTHIFQKLVSFLRAQYPHYGFREVLTPTMYKHTLWEQSGHWTNFKDDMFTVTGNNARTLRQNSPDTESKRMQAAAPIKEADDIEEYGLKPMNCPGHCVLYGSERRSYRDLPIRYAEFSPLHRNEISGALSGLTRVRRFHQDDGHIFCRPSQIKKEITESLAFIRMVYGTLGLADYDLVLSTRPEKDYIGSVEEWDRAEGQLKVALDDHFGSDWVLNPGDGAFYGPKIDIMIQDSDGKAHQTGTIQLDFQLPKRFDLTYESPAPDMEARAEDWSNSSSRDTLGKTTPVMIHRAIFGSLERFMALLLEQYNGQLPFWLSPNQLCILTVSDKEHIKSYAQKVKMELLDSQRDTMPKSLNPPLCNVDIDDGADSIAHKVARAKTKGYNIIGVVGEKNTPRPDSREPNTIDVDISRQPDQTRNWGIIESIKPGSQAPLQKDKGTTLIRNEPGVRLSLAQLKGFIKRLNREYC